MQPYCFYSQLLCFILIGITHDKIVSLILILGIGIGSNAMLTSENMLLQNKIEDDKRSGIMNFNSLFL